MGELGDKRLGDFVPTIDAYRPVALTVAAILGLVFVLPGADSSGSSRVADADATPTVDDDLASAPISAEEEIEPDVGPDDAPAQALPRPGGASVTPSAPAASAARSPARAASPRASAPSARPSASPIGAPGAGSDPAGPSSEPLQISGSGWASATGGAPVPTAQAEGIPDGTLPVGNRLGQVDKASFVRLSGSGSTLVLAEDASGRRGVPFDVVPVQLCQVTEDGWEETDGQAMADAPAHDPEACVPGQQRPDGTWAFLLSAFEDPGDPRGFAIVPTADAPIDFQLTFAGQAVT